MGLVVGIGGISGKVEDGTGSEGDLGKGVGALERVDVLEHNGDETDDVLRSWRRAERVVRVDRVINGTDRDGELRGDRRRFRLTLRGVGRMGFITGVARGRRGEVGAVL